ncbi:MAG TPA: recombinase family protein [Myxococcota bacterium]
MAQRAVAYYRVSRPHGGDAAVSEQAHRVIGYLRARRWTLIEPFVETSSRRADQPELKRALALCRETNAVLLVPELAPLGRDPRFLSAVLAAGVRLAAVDAPLTGRRTLQLLQSVAARTKSDASARTREALRVARQRGARLGSPHPERGSRAGVAALRAGADARARALEPLLEELRLSNPGASLRALAQGLQALGAPTPRGGHWGPSGVRNVLDRLKREAPQRLGVRRA